MSTGTCRAPSVSTANTATWQLSILPRRPHHCRATLTERSPCLYEAALVDDQRAGRLAAQQAIGITGDLLEHWLVSPGRVADEMLKLLLAAILNHGAHHGEGSLVRLGQAMQIAPCHRGVVVRAGAKERAVAVDEVRECIRDALDQRCAQRSSAHTVT